MKHRWLAVLGILAMLLGLLFNPGAVHAQSGASGTVVASGRNDYGQSSVPTENTAFEFDLAEMAFASQVLLKFYPELTQ